MAIEHDPVAAQYESWVYPQPVLDMAEAVAKNGYFDVSDPALIRRKLWPKKVEPDGLDILIAGCGANQAAYYALTNPESRVVGIDISEASYDFRLITVRSPGAAPRATNGRACAP